MANKIGLAVGIALVLVGIMIAAPIATYADGKDKTHMEGIDFSDYTAILLFPTVLAGIFVLVGIGLVMAYGPNDQGLPRAFLSVSILAIAFVGLYWIQLGFAFTDDARTADIQVVEGTSGEFELVSSQIVAYKELDRDSRYWDFRIITKEDRYRLALGIDALNYTDALGNYSLFYNGTLATLQGYNVEREAITDLLDPKVQPGDFVQNTTNYIVFDGVPQRAGDSDDVISFYNVTIWTDSEYDTILASWVIIPQTSLETWKIDVTT